MKEEGEEKMQKTKIEDIPLNSKFKAPEQIKRNRKNIEQANRWWRELSDNQKCLLYWDYLEKVEGITIRLGYNSLTRKRPMGKIEEEILKEIEKKEGGKEEK